MKVRLHSNDESAANATDATIKALPGGGFLIRDEEGKVAFDAEGLATVACRDPRFMAFALRNQGYVKEVIEE